MNKNNTCYLCDCEKLETIHSGVRDDNSIDVMRCTNCSLVCLSTFNHIQKGFYENDGMHNGKANIQNWVSRTKDDDLRRFKSLQKEIKNKKILDFGCGNGGFLSFVKNRADKAFGVEIQKSLNNYHKMRGLNVLPKIDDIEEKFDYITMFHVLEHVKEPVKTLKMLKTKLAKDGKIIIEVPNSNDALISLYNNFAFMNFTYWSCHLYLFNEENLVDLVKKAGFKVNYIKHVQRYGFTNHIWWQIFKKPNGHKKLKFLDWPWLNKFYEKSLAKMKATDTIIVSISPT